MTRRASFISRWIRMGFIASFGMPMNPVDDNRVVRRRRRPGELPERAADRGRPGHRAVRDGGRKEAARRQAVVDRGPGAVRLAQGRVEALRGALKLLGRRHRRLARRAACEAQGGLVLEDGHELRVALRVVDRTARGLGERGGLAGARAAQDHEVDDDVCVAEQPERVEGRVTRRVVAVRNEQDR